MMMMMMKFEMRIDSGFWILNSKENAFNINWSIGMVKVLKRKGSVMNRQIITALIGISVVMLTQAEQNYNVKPIKEHTKIYADVQNNKCVRVLFKVGLTDQLRILSDSDCCYKIIDTNGRVGWIEKNLCSMNLGASKSFHFEVTPVEGYLENPDIIIVEGARDPDDVGISLNRSFKESLRDNVDRESITRMTDK
jgi:hypothetical protein